MVRGLFYSGVNLGELLDVLWGMHGGLRKSFISTSLASSAHLAKDETVRS